MTNATGKNDFDRSLVSLIHAQAEKGQPAPLFDAMTRLCNTLFGYRFLTILGCEADGIHIRRLHSSSPGDYPAGGLKPMGGTLWGKRVLERGETWLGNGRDDVLWAFPDAELILSKGCEACACAPVLWNGDTIGVLSLNAELNRYSQADLAKMQVIAQTLAPALLSSANLPLVQSQENAPT